MGYTIPSVVESCNAKQSFRFLMHDGICKFVAANVGTTKGHDLDGPVPIEARISWCVEGNESGQRSTNAMTGHADRDAAT